MSRSTTTTGKKPRLQGGEPRPDALGQLPHPAVGGRGLPLQGQGHLGEALLVGVPGELPADGRRQGLRRQGRVPPLQPEHRQVLQGEVHPPVVDGGAGDLHRVGPRPDDRGPDGLRPPEEVEAPGLQPPPEGGAQQGPDVPKGPPVRRRVPHTVGHAPGEGEDPTPWRDGPLQPLSHGLQQGPGPPGRGGPPGRAPAPRRPGPLLQGRGAVDHRPIRVQLQEPPADVEAAGVPELPVSKRARLEVPPPMSRWSSRQRRSSARSVGPRPPGGQDGLQIGPGGGHHKVPGEVGQGGQDLPGVLLPGGLPGDDDRPGLDLLPAEPRLFILLRHDVPDAGGVDDGVGAQGGEVDAAAVGDGSGR